MSNRYGQFCPVAKAAEVLGERWTILIIRELLLGCTRFSDLQRGLSQISPTLLTKRLQQLQDCGLIVDRLTSESQVHGGIIGAVNFALFEDRILDRNTGQMVNPNMEWYLIAGMSDIPQIDIHLVDTPVQRARGVIGIGEPPTVSTAAAIANAVRNATGVTIRSLPMQPYKILQALEQEKAGGTL